VSQVENAFEAFLADLNPQGKWSNTKHPDVVNTRELYVGDATDTSFEVVTATASSRPNKSVIIDVWKERHGGRAAGTVIVALYEHHGAIQAAVSGPDSDSPVSHHSADTVALVVERALDATTIKEARDIIADLPTDGVDVAFNGVRNSGLFAWHSLTASVPRRSDWVSAGERAKEVRGKRGDALLKALDWKVTPHGEVSLLRDDAKDRAVAVLLNADESFDAPSLKYGLGISPVEHAIHIARKAEIPWVIAVHGARVRLYAADPGEGVSRAGLATYAELNVDLLSDENLAYATLLLTPAALRTGGTVGEILTDSRDHAAALGTRLRDRIYADVVGGLATIVANRLGDTSEQGLKQAYHVTLVVLFRLLFVAYAEDRELLPYRADASGPSNAYSHKALKTLAVQYAAALSAGKSLAHDQASTSVWDDMRQIWTAVHDGNVDWGVPAYGGNLFRSATDTGQQIDGLELTNAEFAPLLAKLVVDAAGDGTLGPVDFRSLSVREFGTIYEGLLESSLSVAPDDLTLNKDDAYVPANANDEVVVAKGEIYFHNASGARKATGSYFTKAFAVEHLLETALDPTLDEHLARVAATLADGRESDAAREIFDFRVADIAMGSGHFLVGAVSHIADHIESFLAEHPIPAVAAELEALRRAAKDRLSSAGIADGEVPDIRNSDLILRQAAKRCIYGVDINEIAVDLARLALWIHTFVPGLPMSSLDHGLQSGNSLTGIASVGELLDILEPGQAQNGQTSFIYDELVAAIAAADEPLARAALLAESTVDETLEAERLHAEADAAVAPVRAAMDGAIAARLGAVTDLGVVALTGWDAVVERGKQPDVQELVDTLDPVHFPVAFPEVFRTGRERPGFDVVLGNPPWDEVMVEEPKFWQRYEAGIMGLAPAAQKARIAELRRERADLLPLLAEEQAHAAEIRRTLLAGPFPGLGTGDVDYYQAFAWRYLSLLSDDGRLGVVFPRSLLNAAGTAEWREHALTRLQFEAVPVLTNTKRWVFDDVDPRYSVVLLVARASGRAGEVVKFGGPFHSLNDFLLGKEDYGELAVLSLTEWGNGAAFPVLPSAESAEIFNAMRRHPRFDAKPIGDFRAMSEFHATNDRKTFDAGGEEPGRWPAMTGGSFTHWDPSFGDPYAWAEPERVINALQERRLRQARNRRSAFYGLPDSEIRVPLTLPCERPRIAFRDVTNATNTRTVIAALVPPHVVLTNQAPYLVAVGADPEREAALLGVMSAIPFDWYARRYVELHVNFHILNSFPVPRWQSDSQLWRRLARLSGALSAVDDRFSEWAAAVGVPIGGLKGEPKDDAIAEIDALVAHLYGLTREHVEIIYSTFHRGWDYHSRLDRVLAHYDTWAPAAASHHREDTA